MKKLNGVMAVAACLLLGRVDEAKAAPYCLDFTNFCDCVTVNPLKTFVGSSSFRLLFATWDAACSLSSTLTCQGSR